MAYLRQAAIQDAALKIAGKPPCYGCTERTVGCASSCIRYAEWKKHFDDTKKEIYDSQRGEVDAVISRNVGFEEAVRKHEARENAWTRKNKNRRYT